MLGETSIIFRIEEKINFFKKRKTMFIISQTGEIIRKPESKYLIILNKEILRIKGPFGDIFSLSFAENLPVFIWIKLE